LAEGRRRLGVRRPQPSDEIGGTELTKDRDGEIDRTLDLTPDAPLTPELVGFDELPDERFDPKTILSEAPRKSVDQRRFRVRIGEELP